MVTLVESNWNNLVPIRTKSGEVFS